MFVHEKGFGEEEVVHELGEGRVGPRLPRRNHALGNRPVSAVVPANIQSVHHIVSNLYYVFSIRIAHKIRDTYYLTDLIKVMLKYELLSSAAVCIIHLFCLSVNKPSLLSIWPPTGINTGDN